MSVINSMLRDLEQRKGREGSAPIEPSEDLIRGVVVPKGRWGDSRRAIFRGTAVVVVLVALWILVPRMVDMPLDSGIIEQMAPPAQVVDRPSVDQSAVDKEDSALAETEVAEPATETVELHPLSDSVGAISGQAVVLMHDLLPIKVAVGERQSASTPQPPAVQKVEVMPTSDELAEQAYAEAVRALRDGNKVAAEEALTNALDLASDHRGALEALSALLISLGRYDEARPMVDYGLATLPNNALLLQLRARLLMHDGKIDDAIQMLEGNLPAVGVSPESHALLAAMYQKQKQYQRSAQLYGQLLRVYPSNGVWEMGLGIALESMGKREEALSHYKKAIKSGRLKAAALSFVRDKLQGVQGGGVP